MNWNEFQRQCDAALANRPTGMLPGARVERWSLMDEHTQALNDLDGAASALSKLMNGPGWGYLPPEAHEAVQRALSAVEGWRAGAIELDETPTQCAAKECGRARTKK